MPRHLTLLSLAAAFSLSGAAHGQPSEARERPTIVLVHGAFAESSSWNGVIAKLENDGFTVIAAANPLRSVARDAEALSALVRSVPGPVVLVAHSFGGFVITNAAGSAPNVKALVYVAGFMPEAGESSLELAARFPGSKVGQSVAAVPLPDGGQDLYIRAEAFHDVFAADLTQDQSSLMSATQRPLSQAAAAEPSGEPAWKSLPSYAIYGSADQNIPAALLAYMAERARAKKSVDVDGASHAVMISHPEKVAALIEEAALAPSIIAAAR